MPIASYYNPQPGSWGHVTTLSGFFHHVRRGGELEMSTMRCDNWICDRLRNFSIVFIQCWYGRITNAIGVIRSRRRGQRGPFSVLVSDISLLMYVQGVYLIAPCALYGIYSMLSNKVGRIVVGTFLFYVVSRTRWFFQEFACSLAL